MDSAWKTQMSPPLSLLVLGALTPLEHEVVVEDENVERLTFNDEPDLVGITVKVDTVARSRQITDEYRSKGIPVVWGGIYPTLCPEQCMPYADAVVVGEAEILWPELLRDFETGCLKSLYRNQSAVDMAAIPVPRWALMRGNRYLFTNILRIGRGCPWRCDFCYNSSPNINHRYRTKPIENVLREIEALGTSHVMFIDDNFIGNIFYIKKLLQRLKHLNLTWHTAVSADIGRHEDLLDLMAESGCKSLFIGFETLSRHNLVSCGKKQNCVAEYDETIRRIHECGIMVNASLVFGFDHDDETVFTSTLDWLIRNHVETMTAHILTPYPGTRFYSRLADEGRIIDHDLRNYNTAHAVFLPKLMPPERLEEGYRWMYRQFYSWPSIWFRRPACQGQTAAYFQFQLIYRKFGKITCLLGKCFGMRNLARLATSLAYRPAGQINEPLRSLNENRIANVSQNYAPARCAS
jgi:radical SAM superfamily enzyme YgiQ (UPF0313 family)